MKGGAQGLNGACLGALSLITEEDPSLLCLP